MCNKNKVRCLLLLVGSNPLPNAVAGKLLVEPGGTIFLVYSEDTASVAERLMDWFRKEFKNNGDNINLKLVEVEESNPCSIYQKVQNSLKKFSEKESVGLHYTGGTKMMSVHAYRALEHWAQDSNVAPPQYSYLDAKRLQMVFDPPESYPSVKRVYVGNKTVINFEDLLKLHDRTLAPDNRFNREALLPETAKTLAKYCNDLEGYAKCWKRWVEKQKNKIEPSNLVHLDYAVEKILNNGLKEKIKEAIIKSREILIEELGLTQSDNEISLKQSKPNCSEKNFKNWLTGKWLEHYVLDVLNNLAKELKLQECLQNIQTASRQFELDVAAMRGYQLFVFSCKTDSERKELKLALFEASIRAKQLGGDEARTALVCCAEDPEGLESEMSQTMDLGGRIKVFGRKHLAKLQEYVKEWINSQKGEE